MRHPLRDDPPRARRRRRRHAHPEPARGDERLERPAWPRGRAGAARLRGGRRRARGGGDRRGPRVLRRNGPRERRRQLRARDAPAAERSAKPGDFSERSGPSRCEARVAAINGHAIGVGITFPMTCDIRYVAEDAKLQFAFVRRGMIPELGSHDDRPPRDRASRAPPTCSSSGRIFVGREAAELGLASRALPTARSCPPRSRTRASSGSPRPSPWRSASACSGRGRARRRAR